MYCNQAIQPSNNVLTINSWLKTRRSLATIVRDMSTTVCSIKAENDNRLIGINAFQASSPLSRPPRPVAQANVSQPRPTDHAVRWVAA